MKFLQRTAGVGQFIVKHPIYFKKNQFPHKSSQASFKTV